MSYLNISKEVKINHHPRLFSLYFSKKKWKNSMKFQPSHLHLKSKKSPFLFTADFRPGNKTIIDAIIKFKIFLVPFRFILNFLREHFIFSNIFLEPKYGNLYMKRMLQLQLHMELHKKKRQKNFFQNQNCNLLKLQLEIFRKFLLEELMEIQRVQLKQIN